jgi:phenylpropionate dioxygenase-like ring-hydroxylating dioxygenase large terminal subunit
MVGNVILRNAWYVAARSDEIGENALLGRTLLDEPVVMWRGAGGQAVALADRCSHRAVPLSLGSIVDGTLQCGYHGVCFDTNGECVKIPGQRVPQAALPVRAYALVERHGFVWLWFGDAAYADADLIPDAYTAADPAWATVGDRILVKCAHELIVENLNNHSHVQYVHPQIGAAGMADAESHMERVGDNVESKHWLLNSQAPPHFARAGNFNGPVDRWFHTTFLPPTTIALDLGCAVAGSGAPEGNRSQGVAFSQWHLITPETATTTHYFWVYARDFALNDERVDEQIRVTAQQTFEEDRAILEAQQRAMDREPGAPLMNIAVDATSIVVARVREEIALREPRELTKAGR